MRNVFCSIAVICFASFLFAQSEGGIINKNTSGNTELSPWNAEQALASITQPYTCKDADSTAATISTKYGTHYRLAQIRNLSGTTQHYKCSFLTTGDTAHFSVPSYSATGRIPFVKRVIIGAIVDSTGYDFLYKN